MPVGAETFAEALRIGAETFHALKALLHGRGLATAVGDEGGFAPDLGSADEAIEAILEAADSAGHRDDVAIALDPASTELYRDGAYHLEGEGRTLSRQRWSTTGPTWSARYPIVSIEDGLAEDDWDGWQLLTERLGDKLQLVGDDLFVTNPGRLKRGIDGHVANAILIKVNQIGTLSETLDTMRLAERQRLHGRHVAPLGRDRGHHHRRPRGRHELRADQDRSARPARDRVAKYNQLLRIEEELGDAARYPGRDAFATPGARGAR